MTKTMTADTEADPNASYTMMYTEDLFEIVCLCAAAMQKDAPMTPTQYINQINGIAMGPLPRTYRDKIDDYLAEKKYLAPVEIVTSKLIT